jgi:hypothetical protein
LPGAVARPGIGFVVETMVVLTAGALGIMWVSEQLSRQRGDEALEEEHEPMHQDAGTNALEPAERPDLLLESGQSIVDHVKQQTRETVHV